jgi:hypothetical protein
MLAATLVKSAMLVVGLVLTSMCLQTLMSVGDLPLALPQ